MSVMKLGCPQLFAAVAVASTAADQQSRPLEGEGLWLSYTKGLLRSGDAADSAE